MGDVGPLDDLDGPVAAASEGVAELVPGVAAVGEDVPQPGEARPYLGQHLGRSVAVLNVGGGGVEFSLAADGAAVYAPVSDIYVPAATARPGLSALRISDGQLLWSAAAPKLTCGWKNAYCFPGISQAISAMPGVVFAGSMDGRFRAYDAGSGRVMWEYDTGAEPVTTVNGRSAQGGVLDAAGPTIAGGILYLNSNYQGRSDRAVTVLMAFSVDGR